MTSLLATDYTMRAPAPEDMQTVLDFMAACDIADYGEAMHHDPEDVKSWWRREESWLIFTPTGKLAAYASLYDSERKHARFHGDALVHPDFRGHGLEPAMLDLIERRACEMAADAPPEAQITLTSGALGKDQARRELLESSGFNMVRVFWRMRVDMTEAPPAPEWPAGIVMRTYQPGADDRALYDAVDEAFQDHWDHTTLPFEEWMERTQKASFDPALWFIAWDGEQIAGVTLCNSEPDKGWIGNVAVRRPWRKRGLALALVRHALGEFWRRGMHRVELGVDAASPTNAQKLYQRVGMHPAIEWVVYEKVLR
jgi:mycothiol synthase